MTLLRDGAIPDQNTLFAILNRRSKGGPMKSRVIMTTLLVFGAIGFAEAASSPAPPPEIDQLKIFEGTAKCTGNQSASDFGPAHATTGVARGRRDLGGFWITIRYDERKTKANPNPVHALYALGYDPSAKQFLSNGFDGFGGRGTETSSGWEGDKLTFTGEYVVAGKKIGYRDTFTRKGEREIDHLGENQGADGKWVTLDQETCKG
jgi:hypothetical protein